MVDFFLAHFSIVVHDFIQSDVLNNDILQAVINSIKISCTKAKQVQNNQQKSEKSVTRTEIYKYTCTQAASTHTERLAHTHIDLLASKSSPSQ